VWPNLPHGPRGWFGHPKGVKLIKKIGGFSLGGG
jgi:hypothetical protein